jgi:N-acetylglutamate synthase-like GNAT family acetyltransferase
VRLDYRWIAADDLEHLRDIDRSEHITTAYAMKDGVLTSRSVDWHDHGWRDDGGAHSFGHQIGFCREHLAKGARALGCFTPDGQLVGIGVMRPEVEHGVAQLAFLHISRAYRRAGVATELLGRLTAWARQTGARELYVSATPSGSAVSFYQRAGFDLTDVPIDELLALEPEDIHMRRPLHAR